MMGTRDPETALQLAQRDNGNLRYEAEVLREALAQSNISLAAALKTKDERDRLLLQTGEWEKLVRGMADRLYAIGKDARAKGDENGEEYMVIATELHRRCQIIKGEEPLPAAGERLTSGEHLTSLKKQSHESALGTEMTPMERILMEAVNEFCSCGGAGPENGCIVCKIWHRYVARSRKV